MKNASFIANNFIGIQRSESNSPNRDAVDAVLKQVFRETEETGELSNAELAATAISRLHNTQEIEAGIRKWMQFHEMTKFPDDESLLAICEESDRIARKIAFALSPMDFYLHKAA